MIFFPASSQDFSSDYVTSQSKTGCEVSGIAPNVAIFARSRSPWRKAPFQTFLYKLYLCTHCLCGFFGILKSIFDLFIFFSFSH